MHSPFRFLDVAKKDGSDFDVYGTAVHWNGYLAIDFQKRNGFTYIFIAFGEETAKKLVIYMVDNENGPTSWKKKQLYASTSTELG